MPIHTIYYRDHQLNWLGFTSLYCSYLVSPFPYESTQITCLDSSAQIRVENPSRYPYLSSPENRKKPSEKCKLSVSRTILSFTATLAAVTCFRLGSLCTKCTSVYSCHLLCIYIGKVHIQSCVYLYSPLV